MRRLRSFAFPLLAMAASASLLWAPACAGLKQASPQVDASSDALASPEVIAPSDAGADADGHEGPLTPLSDTVCDGPANRWASTTKSDAKCKGRIVRLLESWQGGDGAVQTTGVAIARAPSGRTAIGVHRVHTPEEGELRLFALNGTPEGFAVPVPIRVFNQSGFESHGVGIRIARGSTDDFHVVYQRVDDAAGGPVLYRRLTTAGVLTTPETVAIVPDEARPSLAASPKNDDAVISYFIKPSKVISRFRTGTGMKPEVSVTESILGSAPAAGSSSLAYDTSGQAHVAYIYSTNPASAAPKYVQSNGQYWNIGSQTLDNGTSAGIFGFSIAMAVRGLQKSVAYFARPIGSSTAELRVATIDGTGAFPTIETVLQDIPIPTPGATAVHLDLTFDRLGALHMVAVLPGATCKIAYLRQVPAQAGALKWVEDLVDEPIACSSDNDVQVALTVDESIRAHIVYAVGAVGAYYATRYDR